MTGSDITAHRKSLGLSQEALADKAGVCQSAVSMIERDSAGVSVHLQNCVRQALGLELLAEDAKPEPAQKPLASWRGFASMSPAQHREIASIGGKAAHSQGVAYEFTTATAKAANAKQACRDPEKMRQLGLLGGDARRKAAASARTVAPERQGPNGASARQRPRSSE